jgi:hypothetical protein
LIAAVLLLLTAAPPPQAMCIVAVTANSRSSIDTRRARVRRDPVRIPAKGAASQSASHGVLSLFGAPCARALPPVEIVNIVVAPLAPGVTLGSVNVQVASAGSGPQESATALLKDVPCELTLMLNVTDWPELMLVALAAAPVTAKSAVPGARTLSVKFWVRTPTGASEVATSVMVYAPGAVELGAVTVMLVMAGELAVGIAVEVEQLAPDGSVEALHVTLTLPLNEPAAVNVMPETFAINPALTPTEDCSGCREKSTTRNTAEVWRVTVPASVPVARIVNRMSPIAEPVAVTAKAVP